jgi:hypothetical protein
VKHPPPRDKHKKLIRKNLTEEEKAKLTQVELELEEIVNTLLNEMPAAAEKDIIAY